jgi:hypothetical protein
MMTHEDIYLMMCGAIYEYLHLHGCWDVMFCRKCKNHSYCGIDTIHIAKLMIFDY